MKARALLVALACLTANAELSRIDADGVTETGGGTNYARMITRTGTNGLLSATLLPPVADWASQPIARLYYASASAPVQGNGSPQYPFNDLTYAMSRMSGDSALLMAPGSYSGSGTVGSGRTLTLFGVGGQVRVTGLTVSASGSSSLTTLDLCGLTVDTLTVNGGTVNVRLCDTLVGTLGGNASAVTVTRTDMASRVAASTAPHRDEYTGFQFVAEAGAVVGDGLSRMTIVGRRGAVIDGSSTNALAHVSELTAATSLVYSAIAAVAETNSATLSRIDSEREDRESADVALSNNMAAAIAVLAGDVGTLGSSWGNRFIDIDSRISGLVAELSAADASQSVAIDELRADNASLRYDFSVADSNLNSTLRGLIHDQISGLRGEIPGTSRAQAESVFASRVVTATNSAVSDAVMRANAAAIARESAITGEVIAVSHRLSSLQTTVSGHTTSLASLSSADTDIRMQISALSASIADLRTDLTNLSVAVSALRTWRGQANGRMSDIESSVDVVKDGVNSVIDAMTPLTNRYYTPITLPDKLDD